MNTPTVVLPFDALSRLTEGARRELTGLLGLGSLTAAPTPTEIAIDEDFTDLWVSLDLPQTRKLLKGMHPGPLSVLRSLAERNGRATTREILADLGLGLERYNSFARARGSIHERAKGLFRRPVYVMAEVGLVLPDLPNDRRGGQTWAIRPMTLGSLRAIFGLT